jgi:hypothetical protein
MAKVVFVQFEAIGGGHDLARLLGQDWHSRR